MREVIFCKGKTGLSKNNSLQLWKSLDPMEVSISCLSSEEVYHCIWELSLESLCCGEWHNRIILCMPYMDLGSERSEDIIVLRGREVSL